MNRPIKETEHLGDHIVVRLHGEIDLATSADLADEVAEAVPGTAAGLILDLSDVQYFDSSGMRMLFEVVRRLEARRQTVAVAAPDQSPMRALLKVASVHEAVPVHDTPADCLAALERGRGFVDG
ncbi:MAG: STAS domain-containing protein [Actinomycetota bacterium]|nr:STAS domain-containing protein [Actinomycetota bacterium]